MRLEPQASLYETTIENADLEAALEEREKRRIRVASTRKAYAEANERAKGLAETLDLGDDAPVRVGRFILTRRQIESRSVSFDTAPSTRLTIRTLGDLP